MSPEAKKTAGAPKEIADKNATFFTPEGMNYFLGSRLRGYRRFPVGTRSALVVLSVGLAEQMTAAYNGRWLRVYSHIESDTVFGDRSGLYEDRKDDKTQALRDYVKRATDELVNNHKIKICSKTNVLRTIFDNLFPVMAKGARSVAEYEEILKKEEDLRDQFDREGNWPTLHDSEFSAPLP